MKKKILISGMNSGQNPCSGLGIARSIRRAFPDLHLVGVDHWNGSTGLHDSVIDEVMLLPRWDQIQDEVLAGRVRGILDSGDLWISSLDMEVHWLAEHVGRHRNLLAPGKSALENTAKPSVRAFEGIGFRVPEHIPASLPDAEVHAFLRRNAWQCWLKSPYHDARRINSWGAFERARDQLSSTWKTSKLFVQRNVMGHEETIAFCAHEGRLVGAAHLEKRQLTPEGKTWAACVRPPRPALLEQLEDRLRSLEWSGGGEIEFVRDADQNCWIIECNPRFPAWIFGGALAGINLPARLLSQVLGLPFEDTRSDYPLFTRVVQEIPAKPSVGIPVPPEPTNAPWSGDGKGGKGAPAAAAHLPRLGRSEDDDPADSPEPVEVPQAMLSEISAIAARFDGETPSRLLLESWATTQFDSLRDRIRGAPGVRPEIRIGYSVKTSPTDPHLALAARGGFLAECISQREVHRALRFGFAPSQVILNGPGKYWPTTTPPVTGLHMLFCDSVEEFERTLEIPEVAKCLGFRMRLPQVASRFGNDLEDFATFRSILKLIRRMPSQQPGAVLGFHFHMPSWSIGVNRWMDALGSLLQWCRSIESLSRTPIRRFDLGGGFFPADLRSLDFNAIRTAVHDALPAVEALYFEPGRALTQETEVLVSRVLDVRRQGDDAELEIVVDACIAELPLARSFPRRIFFSPAAEAERANGVCIPLAKGKSRILGRICMEDDILAAQVKLPESIRVGDRILFGDAGGYERSMSYEFGRG